MKKTCDESGFSSMKQGNYGNSQPRQKLLKLGVIFCLLGWVSSANQQDVYGANAMGNDNNGNRFFVQRPFSSPPTVRPPPYFNSPKSCSVLNQVENWEGNLCGDLNKGEIPTNPMGHQDFHEDSNYPFEIIKNKTLDFFRQALPVLKTYKALPKVARFDVDQQQYAPRSRLRRDVDMVEEENEGRAMRRYGYGSRVKRTHTHNTNSNQMQQPHRRNGNNICENAIFCKLINTMYDKLPQGVQRLVSSDAHKRISNQFLQQLKSSVGSGSSSSSFTELLAAETNHVTEDPVMPQTPCPSTAEYVTPVFARNHEGAWRYVVQIPREGYFTQTVEVTKCVQSSCLYLEGSCRTSPRWQSLLVAEMYYPDAAFPLNFEGRRGDSKRLKRSRVDNINPNMQRKRSNNNNYKAGGYYEGRFVENSSNSSKATTKSSQCDGYDEIGCYQFRLFYDWFLLPGECKCWKKSLASLYQKY
ncbi:unnamed protein product [Allacma fusca]|uniref:Spaetzle domain-containing protein n=1 Tax=Allacma fusca TaxID=39272 RepID=A0A8J2KIM9_9HEXA|nr:unnamed protein product [Allacma fusca]